MFDDGCDVTFVPCFPRLWMSHEAPPLTGMFCNRRMILMGAGVGMATGAHTSSACGYLPSKRARFQSKGLHGMLYGSSLDRINDSCPIKHSITVATFSLVKGMPRPRQDATIGDIAAILART